MPLLHAPRSSSSWIKPLLSLTIPSPSSPRILTFPSIPPPYLNHHPHSLRKPSRTLATMSASGDSSPEHTAGNWFSVPDLRLRDHHFTVPLNHKDPAASHKISIFAREVVAVGKEDQTMPYLLYLQGGPGFECMRPTEGSGWILKACEEFRVVLMDQRGTGLSSPLTVSSMLQVNSAEDLAEYLKHFRADSIVKDAEFIRVRLVPGSAPWTILGQSYGGFCAVSYLSFAPQGLKQVLITGGIPPIGNGCTADVVYAACFEQLIRQNEKYYKRFPQDIDVVHEIVLYLAKSEGGGVPLPSGGILTPRGLQMLGMSSLGLTPGFERLHYLFERAWDPVIIPGASKKLSFNFLNAFDSWLGFDSNPLYAILHESIYCQGSSSRWSAHRLRAKYGSKFDAVQAVREGRPVLFTGEMIFPWMFNEIHALKPFKDAAHILAEKEDWPPLYDKAALNNNKVPVAASVYVDDLYVNFNLVMKTVPEIAGIRTWITNEYMHSGLRDAGPQVLEHLLGLLNGKKPLF